MAGKKGQKKRVWSDDEKRSICEQTTTAGVSVAQVARRYSMNANLIFQMGALEIPCHFCKLKKRNDTCEKNLILM